MERMTKLGPMWVDVTWGAGGDSRASESTLKFTETVMKVTGVDVLLHLTCTDLDKETTRHILQKCKAAGLRNILALRGDASRSNNGVWKATTGGFAHASDLVKFIKSEFGDHFCVGVGCYPETHPTATSAEADLKHFKAKVDAGADFAVTQFFFDADVYFLFVERCRDAGIDIPIFPGVMPIQKYRLLQQMTEACKVQVPDNLREQLEDMEDDQVTKFGVATAVQMARKLLAGGAPGLYLYTLNMEASATSVVTELQLNADVQLRNGYPFARSSPTASTATPPRKDSRSPGSNRSAFSAWDDNSPRNGRQECENHRLWMNLY